MASLSASAAYRDGLHIEREAAMDRRMAAHRDAAVRATATDHRALTAAVDAAIADARALDKAAAAFVEALHTYRAPTADLLPMMGRVLKARHAGAQEGLLNATGHLQPHVARNSAASASALACVVDQLCAALGGSAIKDQVAVSQYTVSRGTTFEVAAKQAAEVLKARLGEVKA
ncbi:MAG TPA: hypothetical protein VFR90_03250 [Methylibium sp.]|uniref:hypothetical protein n=1 Tax=Methylibium sp. TaxID=2067992 RepID=UPI002DB5A5FB|nr:hypothetical protein [Methylibium sp.]HEU4458117.1 hypothetical protein [Methylibium sp.]